MALSHPDPDDAFEQARPDHRMDVWEIVLVLMLTLCTLSFAAFALGGALLSDQGIWEILGIAIAYTLLVGLAGFVPLMVYAFFYSFYLLRGRIHYGGAAGLAVMASLLYEGLLSLSNGWNPSDPWALGLIGMAHAVPTALAGHFMLSRRLTPRASMGKQGSIRPKQPEG